MIIKTIILILGIIFFLWFLLPVFGTSLNYGNVTGIILSIIAVVYGLCFDHINRLAVNAWKSASGKVIEIILMIIAAAIIVLAAAAGASMIFGAAKSPEAGSTVIVLGARLYGNEPSRTMLSRCNAAYEYLMENPESVCIVSGGQGDDEKISEAAAMFEVLTAKGIDSSRIFQENRSTDTDENIRFSKEIIEAKGLNQSVAIATNDYHEYRALTYAAREGIKAGSVPAPTLWWVFPTSIVREMYGILEMWFLH